MKDRAKSKLKIERTNNHNNNMNKVTLKKNNNKMLQIFP